MKQQARSVKCRIVDFGQTLTNDNIKKQPYFGTNYFRTQKEWDWFPSVYAEVFSA